MVFAGTGRLLCSLSLVLAGSKGTAGRVQDWGLFIAQQRLRESGSVVRGLGWVTTAQRGSLGDARAFHGLPNLTAVGGDPRSLFQAAVLLFVASSPSEKLPSFETSQICEGPRTLTEEGGTSVKSSSRDAFCASVFPLLCFRSLILPKPSLRYVATRLTFHPRSARWPSFWWTRFFSGKRISSVRVDDLSASLLFTDALALIATYRATRRTRTAIPALTPSTPTRSSMRSRRTRLTRASPFSPLNDDIFPLAYLAARRLREVPAKYLLKVFEELWASTTAKVHGGDNEDAVLAQIHREYLPSLLDHVAPRHHHAVAPETVYIAWLFFVSDSGRLNSTDRMQFNDWALKEPLLPMPGWERGEGSERAALKTWADCVQRLEWYRCATPLVRP